MENFKLFVDWETGKRFQDSYKFVVSPIVMDDENTIKIGDDEYFLIGIMQNYELIIGDYFMPSVFKNVDIYVKKQ